MHTGAGCVYKLAVDRKFSAFAMEALICGKPIDSEYSSTLVQLLHEPCGSELGQLSC